MESIFLSGNGSAVADIVQLTRFLKIPRNNPVNAITMGGIFRAMVLNIAAAKPKGFSGRTTAKIFQI